ncbi:MAG TPA: glycogen/starch synthase [Candidatus Limnocylindrales bacterium]|nr:glycogen/starch synthase [Candidatus Limnocylindrales bacterium]
MRIAMVTSECEPFAKTGGLADVVDALSRALGQQGHEVDVYLPLYRGLEPPGPTEQLELRVPGAYGASTSIRLHSASADGYRLRLVDHPPSYDRPDYYVDGGADYPDNGFRFSLLGRAALEAMRAEGVAADIIHGHDWEGAPALLLLRHRYAGDPLLGGRPTLLTCHNLSYHGWVPRSIASEQLDLPVSVGATDGVDLLREGILAADLVNTVSPGYARESVRPGMGGGVEDALAGLGERYVGILNGIDTALWDPATDTALPTRYSATDRTGKAACRLALCAELGLDPGGPLLGMIGRLDPQKGFDLLAGAASGLVEDGARICVLGTGHAALVSELEALAAARPDRVAVIARFDRDLARRIYAGVDAFLMPSRFEPCGQGQMIAMRYGTPPVVRSTGGLADTVVDADARPDEGTGFCFEQASPEALRDACRRAMAALADGNRWMAIQRRGMALDHSWREPAVRYLAAYEQAARVAVGRG